MRQKIISALYQFIKKYPVLVIILSVIMGVLFFLAFRFIELKSDYIDLLPPKSEPVVTLKYLSEKLKGVGQFSIVIESRSKDTKALENTCDYLSGRLDDMPEIQHFFYKIPKDFIKKYAFLLLDTEDLAEIHRRLHEKIQYDLWKDVPFFISLEEEEDAVEFNIDDIIEKYKSRNSSYNFSNSDYLISPNGEFLVIFLKPNFMPTKVENTGALINKIRDAADEYIKQNNPDDLSVSFAGTYVLSYDQKNAIYKDIKITSLIALIMIFFAIIIFVNNINYSTFLLYALGVGVLSTFGIAYVLLGHLNLITAFLIAILTGLGVNYGIHFLVRFNEEQAKTTYQRALYHSFLKTGRASLTGALTTAVSFFTLSFSKFRGFSEFGMLASAGILITLLATYIVVAACMIITRARRIKGIVLFKTNAYKEVIVSEQTHRRNRKFVLLLSLVMVVVTASLAFKLKDLRFEYDSKKLEVRAQDSIAKTELIQERFNISTDPAIFYTYDRQEEIDFYNTVIDLMSKENSQIGNIISLSTVIKDEEEQKLKIEWLKKIRYEIETLPENAIKNPEMLERINMFMESTASLAILRAEELPTQFKARIMADDNGKPLYISQVFPDKILFNARDMKNFVAEIKTIKGKIKEYFPTGMHILYVYLIDTVLKESKIFITIVFFIIFILLLIDFKNIKDSLIAMVPLIFGVIWLLEIMSFFHIKFNFMNIIVLPVILGTGVDNGVHIYHRYKDTRDILTAIYNTGKANFAMSLTVALGWSALFAAKYQGLKTMAIVGVIGIMMTFIASVTIMPAIILLIDKTKSVEK